jgi:hypothetical protein
MGGFLGKVLGMFSGMGWVSIIPYVLSAILVIGSPIAAYEYVLHKGENIAQTACNYTNYKAEITAQKNAYDALQSKYENEQKVLTQLYSKKASNEDLIRNLQAQIQSTIPKTTVPVIGQPTIDILNRARAGTATK